MTTVQEKLLLNPGHGWFSRLASVFAPRVRTPRRLLLDVRDLPDHLKRDMGILDGNDPAGRHR